MNLCVCLSRKSIPSFPDHHLSGDPLFSDDEGTLKIESEKLMGISKSAASMAYIKTNLYFDLGSLLTLPGAYFIKTVEQLRIEN